MLAALLAVTVGIGFSRFAYSALIPVMVDAGWTTGAEAGYLGAANLAGYLAGALVGLAEPARLRARAMLQAGMLFATAAFLASAFPLSFEWLLGWRVVAGVTGGVLMVLAAPFAMPLVPAHRRGTMSGVIFAGVGIGILLSALVVPLLSVIGPGLPWVVLGAICLVATTLAWFCWPGTAAIMAVDGPSVGRTVARFQVPLVATCLAYGVAALGLVPHMVFLVDFVARDLGQGLAIGALFWSLFGLGALFGPLATGRLGDSIGASSALRILFLVQIPMVALPALFPVWPLLALSSASTGAALSGIVALTSLRMRELVLQPQQRTAAWSIATIAFAIGQAVGGYAFSAVFAVNGGNAAPLFFWGAAAFAAAFAVSLGPYWRRQPSPHAQPVE
ncbi:MAG TPA: YbfB/YjiJ family MFS transporter [Devosiaceae bacterium]|nr:YbfB/YjiJ family MFS transporter [Devosiaceae bacterium]